MTNRKKSWCQAFALLTCSPQIELLAIFQSLHKGKDWLAVYKVYADMGIWGGGGGASLVKAGLHTLMLPSTVLQGLTMSTYGSASGPQSNFYPLNAEIPHLYSIYLSIYLHI